MRQKCPEMQKSSRSTMAPGAGRNIRMIDGSRRRRAVQIRAQGAQTGLVVTNGVISSSAQQKNHPPASSIGRIR